MIAADEEPCEVPLHSIIASPSLQVREKLDAGTVQAYATAMREGREFPPITLARIAGRDGLLLVDGFHRHAAAIQADRGRLPARVLDLSPTEARWEAAKANLSHGLRLRTQRERRAAFEAYMKARLYKDKRGRAKSLRAISADLGGLVSHMTVKRWLMKDHRYVWEGHYAEGHREEGEGPFDAEAFRERAITQSAETALASLRAAHGALSMETSKAALRDQLKALLGALEGGPSEDSDEF